jgi:hypothetical protein
VPSYSAILWFVAWFSMFSPYVGSHLPLILTSSTSEIHYKCLVFFFFSFFFGGVGGGGMQKKKKKTALRVCLVHWNKLPENRNEYY